MIKAGLLSLPRELLERVLEGLENKQDCEWPAPMPGHGAELRRLTELCSLVLIEDLPARSARLRGGALQVRLPHHRHYGEKNQEEEGRGSPPRKDA